MTKRKPIKYSRTELDWIERHQQGINRQDLTDKFNARFERDISMQNIHGLCKRKGWKNGCDTTFKKGSVSWNKGKKGFMGANKTSFKKGQMPYNHKPVGHERITEDGYIMIKTSEPKTFRLKQHVVWEQYNEPVPTDHNLRFLDNDRTNCDIDNLMMIPRSVNAVVNNTNPANTGDKSLNTAILLTETINHHVKKMEAE